MDRWAGIVPLAAPATRIFPPNGPIRAPGPGCGLRRGAAGITPVRAFPGATLHWFGTPRYNQQEFRQNLGSRAERRVSRVGRAAELLPLYWRHYCRELASKENRSRLRPPPALLRNPEAELHFTLDILLSHYRQAHPDVCFLQVGAFDGVSADPIYPLIEKHGLRGYLIEPQADAFARLKANYARFGGSGFVFVNAAIGEKDGTVPLYRIKPGARGPEWLPQTASLDKNFHKSIAEVVPDLESMMEIEQVPCLTFPTLYSTYGIGHVDLLQIDTEGLDAEVLRLFDAASRAPAIVRFEHKHLSEEAYDGCLASLIALGYKISISGADTLAYHWSCLAP